MSILHPLCRASIFQYLNQITNFFQHSFRLTVAMFSICMASCGWKSIWSSNTINEKSIRGKLNNHLIQSLVIVLYVTSHNFLECRPSYITLTQDEQVFKDCLFDHILYKLNYLCILASKLLIWDKHCSKTENKLQCKQDISYNNISFCLM